MARSSTLYVREKIRVCLERPGGRADLGLAGLKLQKRKPQLATAGDVGHRRAEGRSSAARVALNAVLKSRKLHVEVRPARVCGGEEKRETTETADAPQPGEGGGADGNSEKRKYTNRQAGRSTRKATRPPSPLLPYHLVPVAPPSTAAPTAMPIPPSESTRARSVLLPVTSCPPGHKLTSWSPSSPPRAPGILFYPSPLPPPLLPRVGPREAAAASDTPRWQPRGSRTVSRSTPACTLPQPDPAPPAETAPAGGGRGGHAW